MYKYTYCPIKQFRTLKDTFCGCQGGFEPVNFRPFHSRLSALTTRPPALAEHKFVSPDSDNILKLKKEILAFLHHSFIFTLLSLSCL